MDRPEVDCLVLKPDPLSLFPPGEMQSHRGTFSVWTLHREEVLGFPFSKRPGGQGHCGGGVQRGVGRRREKGECRVIWSKRRKGGERRGG